MPPKKTRRATKERKERKERKEQKETKERKTEQKDEDTDRGSHGSDGETERERTDALTVFDEWKKRDILQMLSRASRAVRLEAELRQIKLRDEGKGKEEID